MKNNYGLSAEGGRNGLLDFSVVNTHLIFKGVYLGYTTANTTLSKEMDSIDITFQQKGSKAQDKVVTGMELKIKTSLALAKESLLALLDGVVQKEEDGGSFLTANLFHSLADSKAGPLLLAKSLSDGSISPKSEDHLWFYEAIPMVSGNVIVGGNEQQSREVEFTVVLKELAGYLDYKGEVQAAFGYFGDEPKNLPKVAWPSIPTISHNEANIFLDYKDSLTANGNLVYRISQNEGGKWVEYPAQGVIDKERIVITPLPLAGGTNVNLSKQDLFLFGLEGQVKHSNGSLSAMLPEVRVAYQENKKEDGEDD